jgi:hypothetical protein
VHAAAPKFKALKRQSQREQQRALVHVRVAKSLRSLTVISTMPTLSTSPEFGSKSSVGQIPSTGIWLSIRLHRKGDIAAPSAALDLCLFFAIGLPRNFWAVLIERWAAAAREFGWKSTRANSLNEIKA